MVKQEQTLRKESNYIIKKRQRWDQETIITKGREMFTKRGFDLSMRDLAKELNTQASSLYRHVQSKRELWFAITTNDFEDFEKGMDLIISKEGKSSGLELLKSIGAYFLDFARADFNRFKLMYLYEPPKEKKIGPFEQACKPDSLTKLIQICQIIINQEDLKKIKAKELAIFVFSQILGYTIIKSPINSYLLEQEDFLFIKDSIFDNFILDSLIEGIQTFK